MSYGLYSNNVSREECNSTIIAIIYHFLLFISFCSSINEGTLKRKYVLDLIITDIKTSAFKIKRLIRQ